MKPWYGARTVRKEEAREPSSRISDNLTSEYRSESCERDWDGRSHITERKTRMEHYRKQREKSFLGKVLELVEHSSCPRFLHSPLLGAGAIAGSGPANGPWCDRLHPALRMH